MIERILDRVTHKKPLKIHGEAAVFTSVVLRREVTVRRANGSLFLSGKAKELTPEGEVILINCKRYTPCKHGIHGSDVSEVGTIKVGVERVELEI